MPPARRSRRGRAGWGWSGGSASTSLSEPLEWPDVAARGRAVLGSLPEEANGYHGDAIAAAVCVGTGGHERVGEVVTKSFA